LDATNFGVAITVKSVVCFEITDAAAKVTGKTEANIDGADVKMTGGATIRINSSDTDIT
jgi:type VI secretion system secreted protein VgrG